ncbi:alginate export family protein [Flagellimonas pacifica]|uniref:Alginate export n=1 Tax=Flagellimonas pacifica TaxID=1247520 RepID=A0A285MXR0_9FLAO|nr:alginate export family protein [Allomuricauda parva]SNZ01463.1 Alginate export [Allomuricauda parva]
MNRFLIIAFLFAFTVTNAQLKIDAELKPRFEYRHGFKTLFPDDSDPAAFISQRTRLNAGYSMETMDFFLSFQDVRVWGDVPQLNTADNSGLAIHQAWALIDLNSSFSIKVGRQEIVYDDSRFFGNVDWAQQARSHDVAMLKYIDNSFKMDFGLAFNQDGESLTGNTLTTNTYKAFQYVWLHKDWENFSGSFLFLNNGLQFIDTIDSNANETRYGQTVGSHLNYAVGKFRFTSNLYYQFGKDVLNNDLNAYLIGLETYYKATENTTFGLGFELQSGNDNGIPANGKNEAFNPLYGTNHKFNGLMDYFYVGNHIDNIGLLDIHAKASFKLNDTSSLNLALHNFSAAADFSNDQLGNELDIVYSHGIQKYVTLKLGYSHMFESEGMEILKGNFDNNTNNWGWAMLVIKPTLFQNDNK